MPKRVVGICPHSCGTFFAFQLPWLAARVIDIQPFSGLGVAMDKAFLIIVRNIHNLGEVDQVISRYERGAKSKPLYLYSYSGDTIAFLMHPRYARAARGANEDE